jgi:heme oxygenase (mycobilin-producing)
MLIRIVDMEFLPENRQAFLTLFDEVKLKISAFAGCKHLELLEDLDNPNRIMTYSHWESPNDLEQYRTSELFASTWKRTKILFARKAIAHSFSSKFSSK